MIADALCLFTRAISGLNVRWAGCRPEDRRRVYFANHTSHLDVLVIWAALPRVLRRRTRPVAARDYWEAGRIRRAISRQIVHAVLVERRAAGAQACGGHPLEGLFDALDSGSSLIFFPEGTRNPGEDLLEFKSGLFHLARKCPGPEYVPVYLENLNRILPKGECLPIPLLGSVTFGRPLELRDGEAKDDFLKRARAAIEEMRPW